MKKLPIKIPIWTLSLALTAAYFLCSCTQSIKVSHSGLNAADKKQDAYQTKVLILASPDHLQKSEVKSALFAVGVLNRWQFDVNGNLVDAIADLFRQHYSEVVVTKSLNGQCQDCGMIVRPRLIDISVNNVSMQASLKLELQISDTHDNPITTITSKGSSPIFSLSRVGIVTAGYFVPFIGSVLGEPVVKGTLKAAMDKAIKNTDLALTKQIHDRKGMLARTWHPKKTQYGKHEYAAELVARRLGCDLRTDGIVLQSQQFAKEVYQAYCWGKEPFDIQCEYGQCQADAPPKFAAQQEPKPEDTAN